MKNSPEVTEQVLWGPGGERSLRSQQYHTAEALKPFETHLANFDHFLHCLCNHAGVILKTVDRRERLRIQPKHSHPPSTTPLQVPVTYLRCRSMLEADSSMAVGLAIFLPTAWANGCRAPCGKEQARIIGRRQACAEVQVYKMY